jgi:uncharacterized membrane protein
MGGGHSHGHGTLTGEAAPRRSGRERRQEQRVRRRALVLMAAVLVPFGLATVAGLVVYWPDPSKRPVPDSASAFAAPGVSFPRGTVTGVRPVGCDATGPGSTDQAGPDPGSAGSPGAAGGPGGSAGAGTARAAGAGDACGLVAVRVRSGPEGGRVQTIQVSADVFRAGISAGDEIKLVRLPGANGVPVTYTFLDFVRQIPVLALALAFGVVVIAVARVRGAAALVGLGLACVVLGKFMLPALLAGEPALAVGLAGSSAIMFVVLYLAHGVSARTTTALLGTLFGLLVMAGLGVWATSAARLTGLGSEDNVQLTAVSGDVNLSGIVLVGLLIAGLGVLNDVTITQASAVWELYETAPRTSAARLFGSAMRIGRDHIASTVYTIAFAYVGAALPVLLLLSVYRQSVGEALFSEALAEELVRTLVGSIGLVLAIPLTTLIAVAVVKAVSRPAEGRPAAG